MFMHRAAHRRRRAGGGPPLPPLNTTAPGLIISEPNLLYTAGVWEETVSVIAQLFVDGVDTAPALPSMPILPEWREKSCQVKELATGPGGLTEAVSVVRTPAALGPPIAVDPLTLFTAGGGVGTGVLLDTILSPMFSDDGTTPALYGGPVYRIVDRVAGLFSDQIDAAAQGTLQADGGILTDGIDDRIPSPLTVAQISLGDWTVLTVSVIDATPPDSGIIYGQRTNNGNRFMQQINSATGKFRIVIGNAGLNVEENPASPDARGQLVCVTQTYLTGTETKLFVNGVEYGVEPLVAPPTSGANPGWHNSPGVVGPLKGTFKGGLIISRRLTTEEMRNTMEYWK